MRFYVMYRTYEQYGGHARLSLIADLLLDGAGDFGAGVSELFVTLNFPHAPPPKKSLEESFARFHEYRRSLPSITFRRERGEVMIDVASDLIDGSDWKEMRAKSPLSARLFKAAAAEVVEALLLLGRRLTDADDFHLERFLTHCRAALERLPDTAEGLASLLTDCERKRAEKFSRPK